MTKLSRAVEYSSLGQAELYAKVICTYLLYKETLVLTGGGQDCYGQLQISLIQ